MAVSQPNSNPASAIIEARETFDTLQELSKLLNTGTKILRLLDTGWPKNENCSPKHDIKTFKSLAANMPEFALQKYILSLCDFK